MNESASRAPINDRVIDDLVMANHILAHREVVDAFGHVSVRTPGRTDRFLISRSMAPALVTAGDILELDLDGTIVGELQAKPYAERFIHSAIYRARPDVIGIVHSHSPSVIPFTITPVALQAVYHMSGFIGTGLPVFDIRPGAGDTDMLISNSGLGEQLAHCLGGCHGALQRGHGSVVVGSSLREAVFRAIYLEINARVQATAHQLGPVQFLNAEESRKTDLTARGQVDRAWDIWARDVARTK